MKIIFITFLCSLMSFMGNINPTSLKEAINLYENKQFGEAQEIFENYLNDYPKNAIALEYLGDIAFHNKNWNTAANYFKPLLSIDEKNPRYHFKYAGAIGMKAKENKLKAMFLIDDIKKHFIIAADLDPLYIEPRAALVQLFIELPSMLGGSIAKANKYANELIVLNPEQGKKAMTYIESNK